MVINKFLEVLGYIVGIVIWAITCALIIPFLAKLILCIGHKLTCFIRKLHAYYTVRVLSRFRSGKNFDVEEYSKPWGDSLD